MSIEKATADTERATVAIGNYRTHLDETKRGLAKLLARENISVRHEAVSTAMFDIVNRVLVLPKFDSVSVDQYDLLIGHEVGHAKYSSGPTSVAILEKCRDFDGLHTYVNVLEDTRIERLMKDEYPGLRASFRRGYADFATHGPLFQEVVGEDIVQFDKAIVEKGQARSVVQGSRRRRYRVLLVHRPNQHSVQGGCAP